MPVYVRGIFNEEFLRHEGTSVTAGMQLISLVITFALWKRFESIPGHAWISSVFLGIAIGFSVPILIVAITRMEYNRYLLLVTPALTFLWLSLIRAITENGSQPIFAIIPGGNVDAVLSKVGTEYPILESPERTDHTIDGYIVDLRANHTPRWEEFIADATLASIPVYHYKQIMESFTGQVEIHHLSENVFGSVLPNMFYLRLKAVLDVLVTALAIPFLLVAMAIISMIILIVDGRPIFYRQARTGYRGKAFFAYKFRTMSTDPELARGMDNPSNTLENDPRITKLGHLLRRTRLDEIPQCINILKGEMSWIGPRPEAVDLANGYERELPFYRYRHAVRPGLSGWAQVNQGHVTSVDDVYEKLKYDFYYIKNVSPILDILILFRTIRTVLTGAGAK